MRNFECTKPLKECSESDLAPGTAFELTLDGAPVRRGVTVSGKLCWFVLKSHTPDELFSLEDHFSEFDLQRLVVRPVPKYEDFAKKVPAKIRARNVQCVDKRHHGDHRPLAKNGKIHPDLNMQHPTSLRPHSDGPICSPPLSPKRAKKQSKPSAIKTPPLKVVVLELSGRVADLASEIMKLKKSVKKICRRRPLA